jgi:hypothetical protein
MLPTLRLLLAGLVVLGGHGCSADVPIDAAECSIDAAIADAIADTISEAPLSCIHEGAWSGCLVANACCDLASDLCITTPVPMDVCGE